MTSSTRGKVEELQRKMAAMEGSPQRERLTRSESLTRQLSERNVKVENVPWSRHRK